ncbi:class 1 alpha-mannosidase [Niveomyces insectorum RCEF 264]|uniref:DNA replication complex GINS protein PSF2 n=1 Tax=Niveomyces insectorum RCEF 264 TaxID=1081102 RepID=A0A162JBH2_9HYPO|nr:class 1 alpha-mannosidase [Niveomyces insectorum RCEF 264]
MALPLQPGLLPAEVAFLCEMELVTVVPRQRLDPIHLLGGETPPLRPPRRAVLPLWLALLLKRQRRASIVAPPWLHPASLRELVLLETRGEGGIGGGSGSGGGGVFGAGGGDGASEGPIPFSAPPPPPARADARYAGTAHRVGGGLVGGSNVPLAPPFLPSCTAESPAGFLPYHWFEVAEILLAHAPDDLPAPAGEPSQHQQQLLLRGGDADAENNPWPAVVNLRGIGAMELAEARGFVTTVHDGMRKLGAAAEASRRDEEEAAGADGGGGGAYDDDDDDDDDDDMGI